MKAPDKIYYHKGALRTPFAMEKKADDSDICYIRKDALLEWAEEEIEKTSIGLSEYAAGHENARMELLNDFIDKLKSM